LVNFDILAAIAADGINVLPHDVLLQPIGRLDAEV
jgi:hypothetical protein